MLDKGKVLIFVAHKIAADQLSKNLSHLYPSVVLHGDKHQSERSDALRKFKKSEVQILIATDVASRGLHIDEVRYVIMYYFISQYYYNDNTIQ